MFRDANNPYPQPRINPVEEAKKKAASSAMDSRTYIARFTKADQQPIEVVDEASARAREAQIIGICRRICPVQTNKVKDAQVLGLHRNFMSGRL